LAAIVCRRCSYSAPAEACPNRGARNVEVGGTHSGLAFNATVYRVLAEELAR